MVRRRSSVPGYFWLIVLLLFLIVIIQFIRINKLQSQLEGITVFDLKEESLVVKTAAEVEKPLLVATPRYINHSFSVKSPFNDGKTLAELIDEYVKYGSSDMFGSPRRTGNIRRIHEGIDLYVDEDTPVYPVYPYGIVTEVSHDPEHIFQATGYRGETFVDSVGVEYGKIVRILYPEGIESLYAHLNEVYVERGQLVDSGTIVGLTGYTGNIRFSGKPSHLHLELRDVENKSFDPEHRMHYNSFVSEVFMEKLMSLIEENDN